MTELADRLILSNKAAFTGHRTFAASIIHSLMKLPSVNGLSRSAIFCTILQLVRVTDLFSANFFEFLNHIIWIQISLGVAFQ